MKFLVPAGLGLLALAIPILLLYMLKLRRKQVQVSSTLLWTQILRDRQANAPWQKLKRNLLLILQLLILAALVLAFARPAIRTRTVASGSVIVLLDGSASMNATDVSPTRFEAARRSVHSIIDGLNGASTLTLILVGQTPQALIASERDKSLLRDALSEAEPSQGPADWTSAFAVAAGAAHGSQQVTTVIVSDGGLPESGLPTLPGEVRYLPIGQSDDNLAISALSLRAADQGPQLFAEVSNYSDARRTVLFSLYLGDELLSARQMDLEAGARQSFTLDDLPDTPGIYRAQLSDPQGNQPLDALSLDDTAFAIYQATSERRVLLVSKGNLYLEQLLASLPGIRPFRALPGEDGNIQIPKEPFDLYILDGITPDPLPAGNLLFINPSSNPLFSVGAPFEVTVPAQVSQHALTRYVDWSNIHILQARTVQHPDWADILVETDSWPLVFAGQADDRRVAALTFDLRESDLPLQVAYPILFSNLIDYLVPPAAFDATQSLSPGQSLSISLPPEVERVVIASPSDTVYNFKPASASLAFTETGELGFYAVNFLSKDKNSYEYFAVNLFDEAESNLRPRQTIQVGRTAVSAATSEQVGQRELWPWLAALALLILLIEWQVYHHRTALPLKLGSLKFLGRPGGSP
jgi:Ca-activated chloride channel family protein